MKRTILTMMTVCMALMMTYCRKQNTGTAVPSAGEPVYITMTAQHDGEKLDITTAGIVTWTTGDRLLMVSPTSGILGTLLLSSGAGTHEATFEGTINNWTTTECLRVYYLGQGATYPTYGSTYTLDITDQSANGTTCANIASKFYVMKGTTRAIEPGTTKFGPVTLTPWTSIAKFDTRTKTGFSNTIRCKEAWNTATLDLKTGAVASHTTGEITLGEPNATTFMALIPGTSIIIFTDGMKGIAMNRNIEAGRFYTTGGNSITIEAPAGTIPNVFSVGAGKQVYFSNGNLYYDGAFKFEQHQYDIKPTATSGATTTVTHSYDPSHVSHFYWTTDKTQSTGTSISTSGSATDILFTNATAESPKADFNVNGETGTNAWRSLSVAEWKYLIGQGIPCRANAANLRRWSTVTFDAAGTIVLNGLVIMPDEWEGTLTSTTNYDTWRNLEAAGAVFLYASGYRLGSNVGYYGHSGECWSSQVYETAPGVGWVLFFINNNSYMDRSGRDYARSIRLVRDVKLTTTSGIDVGGLGGGNI